MRRVRAYSIVLGLGFSGAVLNCGGDDTSLFAPTAGSGGDIGSNGGGHTGGGAAGSHQSNGGSAGSASDMGGGAGQAQGGAASGGQSVGGRNSGGSSASGGASGHGGSSGNAGQGGTSSTGGHGGTSGSGGRGGTSGSAGVAGSAGLGGFAGVGGSAGDTGAAGAGGTDSCTDSAGCSPSEYCAKVACASLVGHCVARPLDCSAEAANAVCGCDGISYHDACLLQKSGQNKGLSNQSGACAKGAPGTLNCTSADSVACTSKGGVCGFKVGAAACSGATTTTEGVCWLLPAVCPAADPQAAASCSADAGAACLSECAAIQEQQPYTVPVTCGAS